MTMLLIGSTLASLGLPTGVVRYLPIYVRRDGERVAAAVAARAVALSFVVGIVAGGTVILASPWLAALLRKPEANMVLRVVAVALPFGVLRISLAAVATARHNAVYQNLSDITRVFISFAGVVVGVWLLGLGLRGAVWSIAIGEMVAVLPAVVGSLRVFRNTLGEFFRLFWQAVSLRELILFCFPVILIQLTQLGLYQVNVVLGARWLEHKELGIYTGAAQLASVGTLGLVAVGDIFRPSVAVLHDGRARQALASIFHSATRWVYYLVMPVMVFMFVRAEEVLGVFGKDFPAGSQALRILCVGQMINASTGNVGHMLVMSGRQWLHLLDNSALVVVNVILCASLAPSLRVLGVSVASSAAIALVNLLRAVQVYYFFRISPLRKDTAKVLAAALLGGIVLLVPLGGATVQLLGGALLYAITVLLILWALGIPPEDRMVVRQLLSRGQRPPAASGEDVDSGAEDSQTADLL
jgi:O-antigen/teichoic acid export membrane protein